MAVGDYTKTEYVNGGAPGIGAERLNNNENKTEELDTALAGYQADYAYQTPTIVGTQIRITKQSSTARLYFFLNADLSGGAITISLDAGATSKPLQDIEGVAIIELAKGFVEVIADATFFTLRPRSSGSIIKSYQRGNLTFGSGQTLTVNITGVDTSKSIIRLKRLLVTGSEDPSKACAKVKFSSASQIEFAKTEQWGAGSVKLAWEVIEFASVKSLQRGLSAMTGTGGTISINAVNLKNALLFYSYSSTSDSYANTEIIGTLSSTTAITISRNNSYQDNVEWQVVEFS